VGGEDGEVIAVPDRDCNSSRRNVLRILDFEVLAEQERCSFCAQQEDPYFFA